MSSDSTEEQVLFEQVRFDAQGLVPAVVQDAVSGQVRMLGYMNRDALRATLESGRLTFWSRSRSRLWQKGETSGNTHEVVEIRLDCDGDALLVRVHALGPTCHTGAETCFDEQPALVPSRESSEQVRGFSSRVVDEVAAVVAERQARPLDGSYTSYLLSEGIDKIGKKIGEEAAEVIIAAKNGEPGPLANESADLIYHLLVLLQASGVAPERVWDVLSTRRGRPVADHSSR